MTTSYTREQLLKMSLGELIEMLKDEVNPQKTVVFYALKDILPADHAGRLAKEGILTTSYAQQLGKKGLRRLYGIGIKTITLLAIEMEARGLRLPE